jgi:YVTN family beta-propeller protein
MEFTKDGKYLFAALGPGNRVAVIDPKTYEVKDYILVGQRPWHLELSPDQSKLYVANGLTNDMTIIDVASLKAEKSVPVGRLLGAWPWFRKVSTRAFGSSRGAGLAGPGTFASKRKEPRGAALTAPHLDGEQRKCAFHILAP